MSGPARDRLSSLRAEHEKKALALVKEAIKGLRFGVVSVIVQDGLVIQVERNEKFRLLTSLEKEKFREGEGI